MAKKTQDIKLLLDNEYCKIERLNGMMIATWKVPFVDLNIAKNVVNSRLSVAEGQNYPFLIRINSIKNSTKEARDYLSSETGGQGIIAAAIFVDSILTNMLATFFIFLNKPKIPAKIFKDEIKAMEWLEKFVVNDSEN